MALSSRSLRTRLALFIVAIVFIPLAIFFSENGYLLDQPYLSADLTRYPDSSPTVNAASPSGGAIYETFRPVVFFGKRIGFCRIRIEHGKVSSMKWEGLKSP
jgi:hypothetical protein